MNPNYYELNNKIGHCRVKNIGKWLNYLTWSRYSTIVLEETKVLIPVGAVKVPGFGQMISESWIYELNWKTGHASKSLISLWTENLLIKLK